MSETVFGRSDVGQVADALNRIAAALELIAKMHHLEIATRAKVEYVKAGGDIADLKDDGDE